MPKIPSRKVDHDIFERKTFDEGQRLVWDSLRLPLPPITPDLDGIRDAQANMTEKHQRQIEKEQKLEPTIMRFSTNSKETRAITAALHYMEPFAYRTKLLYARARPDQFGVKPSIETPLHPLVPIRTCYASLHDARRHDVFESPSSTLAEEVAEDIAYNRVRAGVHYPSDSKVSSELIAQLRCPIMRHLADMKMVPESCTCKKN